MTASLSSGSHADRGCRILIVEDELLVAHDLQLRLQRMGYEVTGTADSCDAALAIAAEHPPDLVLMDVHIRGERDGISTAALLRERHGAAIVYVTAFADAVTVERATRTEPYGYLIKPFGLEDVRTAIEIAAHKARSDRRLSVQERWYATMLEAIADAVVACDPRGVVAYANPAAREILGRSHESMIGAAIAEVVSLADLEGESIANPLVAALVQPSARAVAGRATVREGGAARVRVIDHVVAPIVSGTELLGAVIVFRDVTEQQLVAEQLQQADRLNSLGAVAASLTHEISNPLSYVIANLEFALAAMGARPGPVRLGPATATIAQETIVEALTDAHEGGRRIARLVGDLRSFARGRTTIDVDVSVSASLAWALRLTQNQLRHCARVISMVDPLPTVRGDEVRLAQVFVNLLVNAAQAITGPVLDNEIAVRAHTDELGWAVVEVRDTGGGMSEATQARIFEAFYTTKGERGSGLGLAISRTTIEAMGGEILVTSSPGVGSVFCVRLPPAPPSEAHASSSAGDVDIPGAHVLVVDDDALVVRSIRRVLEPPHRVVGADGYASALALLERRGDFDMVLCDMMLGEATGAELQAEVARFDAELAKRFVFTSGGPLTESAVEFLTRSTTPCVYKPVSRRRLRELVRELRRARGG